jgi:hypothetical protein
MLYGPGVDQKPAKIYVCHVDHEHDRIYAENVVEYLDSKGVSTKAIQLASDSNRPELEECLDDAKAAVLGFNAHLDHSGSHRRGFSSSPSGAVFRFCNGSWITRAPAGLSFAHRPLPTRGFFSTPGNNSATSIRHLSRGYKQHTTVCCP